MSLVNSNSGVTLRVEKVSALTYNEMDQNFSSFFYSASAITVNGANKLRLYYTGSNSLDSGFEADRYMEVFLPDAEGSAGASVAGNNTEIQFNSNGSFGSSANFVFTGNKVGIGISPNTALQVKSVCNTRPSEIRVTSATNSTNANSCSLTSYYSNATRVLSIGKLNPNSDSAFLRYTDSNSLLIGSQTCTQIKSSVSGVLIGSSIGAVGIPSRPLTVAGTIGVGDSQATAATVGLIGTGIGSADLVPNNSTTNGLLIQSPQGTDGGHVSIGINTDNTNLESFSILKGCGGTYDTAIATFRADGNVGIGQIEPADKFHVEGNITGSGNLEVQGSGTFKTLAEANSSGHLIANHHNKVVVTSGTQNTLAFQYAAPVPIGGIIMWSGTIASIPEGWVLCDGNDGDSVVAADGQSITVPNLTNKFIVGANADISGIAKTTIIGQASQTGGSTSCKLVASNIPTLTGETNSTKRCVTNSTMGYSCEANANLCAKLCFISETWNDNGVSDNTTFIKKFQGCSDPNTPSHVDSSNAGSLILDARHKHGLTVGTAASQQTSISTVPPYYALAYIIYVGV